MANKGNFHNEIEYRSYREIVDDLEFGKDKVFGRYERLLQSAREFIQEKGWKSDVICNETVLMRLVLEYFADIKRLKEFHELKKINEIKIIAYETAWLLKRKPLQIINGDIQRITYCNEQFVYSQILKFLPRNNNSEESRPFTKPDSFTQFLFYHLQYRNCEPQVLELMLESFFGGRAYQRLMSTNPEGQEP
jgi:hypothetical protein